MFTFEVVSDLPASIVARGTAWRDQVHFERSLMTKPHLLSSTMSSPSRVVSHRLPSSDGQVVGTDGATRKDL